MVIGGDTWVVAQYRSEHTNYLAAWTYLSDNMRCWMAMRDQLVSGMGARDMILLRLDAGEWANLEEFLRSAGAPLWAPVVPGVAHEALPVRFLMPEGEALAEPGIASLRQALAGRATLPHDATDA